MKQVEEGNLWEEVEKVKDFHERNFTQLTDNFYIMRAVLRYYSVKQGKSITSADVSDNFPLTAPVAGSCLTALEELGVVEKRSESSSKSRYLPQDVDMERMAELEEVLKERLEIEDFLI
jgi:hypothetical protein